MIESESLDEKPLSKTKRDQMPGGKGRFFFLWGRAWQEAIEGDEESAMSWVRLLDEEGYGINSSYFGNLKRTLEEVGRGQAPTFTKPPFAEKRLKGRA